MHYLPVYLPGVVGPAPNSKMEAALNGFNMKLP